MLNLTAHGVCHGPAQMTLDMRKAILRMSGDITASLALLVAGRIVHHVASYRAAGC
jgi:hypothetical protein